MGGTLSWTADRRPEDPGDTYHVNARHLLYPSCSAEIPSTQREGALGSECLSLASLTHQAAGAPESWKWVWAPGELSPHSDGPRGTDEEESVVRETRGGEAGP